VDDGSGRTVGSGKDWLESLELLHPFGFDKSKKKQLTLFPIEQCIQTPVVL